MLHDNPNPSVLTVSPPDSGFAPRREFLPDNHVSSSFALLSLAGTGLVRLTSFPDLLVDRLKRTFEVRQLLRGMREEKSLHLFEFSLSRKPWSSTKSIKSERLFLDILTIIFQHGYSFMTTLDYGREHDDRITLAFSKPKLPGTNPDSPYTGPTRVPFALSFPSSTVLRVINPPLSTTPAILRSVRSAWPRGVVSERIPDSRCYEFKLKGYRWYQEDTFSSDSLHHILSLLNSLDQHSFSLMTSLSLSGSRSRIKDLWIFFGPPQDFQDLTSSGSSSGYPLAVSPGDSLRSPFSLSSSTTPNHSADALHLRNSATQLSGHNLSPLAAHMRSASDGGESDARTGSPSKHRSVLRKRSGAKYVGSTLPSLSYSSPGHSLEELGHSGHSGLSQHAPSTVGSVDMTGIGSANQRNFTTKQNDSYPPPLEPALRSPYERGPAENRLSMSTERVKTGDLFYETGSPYAQTQREELPFERMFNNPPAIIGTVESSPDTSNPASRPSSRHLTPRDSTEPPSDVPESIHDTMTPGTRPDSGFHIPNAFRDSAFSSNTIQSHEIPIKWTGGSPEDENWEDRISTFPGLSFEHNSLALEIDGHSQSTDGGLGSVRRSYQRRSSSFSPPGAWQPSPIDEKPEEQMFLEPASPQQLRKINTERMPERKDVDAERVASPTLSDTLAATRRSEVALYDMVPERNKTTTPQQRRRDSAEKRSSGQGTGLGGWVLVNVTDTSSERPTSSSTISGSAPSSKTRTQCGSEGRSQSWLPQQEFTKSPVAKAIAAADAVRSSPRNSPEERNSQAQPSGLRRLFHRSKASKAKPTTEEYKPTFYVYNREDVEKRTRKQSMKDKWLKKGSTAT